MVEQEYTYYPPVKENETEKNEKFSTRAYKSLILFLGKNYGYSEIFNTREVSNKKGVSSHSGYIRRLCRELSLDGYLDVHNLENHICYSLNEKGIALYNRLLVSFYLNSVPRGKAKIEINEQEINIMIKLKRHLN